MTTLDLRKQYKPLYQPSPKAPILVTSPSSSSPW